MAVLYKLFGTEAQWDQKVAAAATGGVEMIDRGIKHRWKRRDMSTWHIEWKGLEMDVWVRKRRLSIGKTMKHKKASD